MSRGCTIAILGGALALISGCGSLAPDVGSFPVEASGPVELQKPPEARINGVAGDPTSWCGWGGCVDGFRRAPQGLPVASPPFVVDLPDGAHIESASAFVAGAPDQHHYLDIDGAQLGGFPDGTVMMSVSLRWEDSRDASYYWALDFDDSGS